MIPTIPLGSITTDVGSTWGATLFAATHLKLRANDLNSPDKPAWFGVISKPEIPVSRAREVLDIAASSQVVVLGYDVVWGNPFIWRGTGAEFHQIWEVD